MLFWEFRIFNGGNVDIVCALQEGSQFCRGFGGIGGILRYQLDMRTFDEVSDGEYGDYDEDD